MLDHKINNASLIKYERNKHNFFDELVTFLSTFSSFTIGFIYFGFESDLRKEMLKRKINFRNDFFRLALSGQLPEITSKNPDIAPIPELETFTITIQGTFTNTKLHFRPYNLMYALAFNLVPNSIELILEQINNNYHISEDNGKIYINEPIKRIAESMFINYFEKNRNLIKLKYGKKVGEWSNEIWKFAWVIRNACAHGGKINWTNTDINEVIWKGQSFIRTRDNGREILFDYLSIVDLILLMEDMDKVL